MSDYETELREMHTAQAVLVLAAIMEATTIIAHNLNNAAVLKKQRDAIAFHISWLIVNADKTT